MRAIFSTSVMSLSTCPTFTIRYGVQFARSCNGAVVVVKIGSWTSHAENYLGRLWEQRCKAPIALALPYVPIAHGCGTSLFLPPVPAVDPKRETSASFTPYVAHISASCVEKLCACTRTQGAPFDELHTVPLIDIEAVRLRLEDFTVDYKRLVVDGSFNGICAW